MAMTPGRPGDGPDEAPPGERLPDDGPLDDTVLDDGPAAGTDGGRELLACGRDAATAWDRAEAGVEPDEHERTCAHCTAAFADARGLDAMVHRMAAERLDPPPSVMHRVMDAVLTEFRPHDVLTLHSPLGPARVRQMVVAAGEQALGVPVARVDIEVVDVFEDG